MRATSVFRKLLAVTSLFVAGVLVERDAGVLVLRVKPTWRKPRCGCCGREAPYHDSKPRPKHWKTLPWGWFVVVLEYRLRRVHCPDCGIHVEMVPWARKDSRFTRDLEEMAAHLAKTTDKTAVSQVLGITWGAVGSCVERVASDGMDESRFDNLRRIGIDEFSYRKKHRYITTVVDHDTGRVIWAAEGRSSQTLESFFDELGEERCKLIETVTMDMAGGYIKATRKRLPNAQIVFDRFHVQRLASDALDEVRRSIWRQLKGTDEGSAIKGMRFTLLKRKWKLDVSEKDRLRDLEKTNKPLFRAYLLKERLAKILDYVRPGHVRRELDRWLWWASHSRLEPFVKVARTIRKHKQDVLAYIEERYTNGIVEGFNNLLRMVARRAFGFHTANALIKMLFLVAGGIETNPPLPGVEWLSLEA